MYGHLGLKINYDMALIWLKEAAEGGVTYAQRRLGFAYENGELGPLD